jgi:hypothetical protein
MDRNINNVEEYDILAKDVKYLTNFITNWEVFDFTNLRNLLNKMEEIQQVFKSNNLDKSESCDCGKSKRYCKGCLCDVTDTMFCYCGEQVLTLDCTYSDDDIVKLGY